MRNLDSNYELAESHFNRWAASQTEVNSAEALYTGGKATLDLVLEAQRRRAQAQVDYYRALIDHTKSIADVHFRKGSLLEYCNVQLAEGPWPQKAYWDAWGHARRRAASRQLDYGWTRPRVISRGALPQQATEIEAEEIAPPEAEPIETLDRVPVPASPAAEDPPADPQKEESILKSQTISDVPIGTGVVSPAIKQVDYQRQANKSATALQDPVINDWVDDRVKAVTSPSTR